MTCERGQLNDVTTLLDVSSNSRQKKVKLELDFSPATFH